MGFTKHTGGLEEVRQNVRQHHAHLQCSIRSTSCYWSVSVCWKWRHDWSRIHRTAAIPDARRRALQYDVTHTRAEPL